MDIDISYPASTSDYLAFGTSPICDRLYTEGLFAPGLTIYGNNTYMNTPYMTSPFKDVSSVMKDDYNIPFPDSKSILNVLLECW